MALGAKASLEIVLDELAPRQGAAQPTSHLRAAPPPMAPLRAKVGEMDGGIWAPDHSSPVTRLTGSDAFWWLHDALPH